MVLNYQILLLMNNKVQFDLVKSIIVIVMISIVDQQSCISIHISIP